MKKANIKVQKKGDKSTVVPNKQITLIRKANELVEARYKFDIWETRIFLEMLTKISPSDEGFKDYKIYLKDFVKDFFLEDNKNTYRLAKEASKKLMGKLIEAKINRGDGKFEDFVTPVVSSFKGRDQDNDEASYIKLSFHPDLRPFLLELKERYVTYDFNNVANLSSPYYVRIYELLKQYEKIGKRRMEVEELKAMLGIVNEYKSYGHFKDKIIEKAQINLLKYTDIGFDFEEVTNGAKKVVAIIFYIYRNVPAHRPVRSKIVNSARHLFENNTPTLFDTQGVEIDYPVPSNTEGVVAEPSPSWLDAYADTLRVRWNISPSHFILKTVGKTEDDVKKALAFTEERIEMGKATNPAGVFLDALEKNHTPTSWQKKDKEYAQRQKEEALAKKKTIAELEQNKVQMLELYDNACNDAVRKVVANDPSVSERAMHELQTAFIHLRDTTLDDFRKTPILRGMMVSKIKSMYPEAFEHTIPMEQSIKLIGAQIEALK